ncbi:ribokinase [Aquihabitans sp. McL0605]|uniref:ribokinase n=1 Tax=Aquihabitans sp. McL0605 TaxID=3415671 RepID=UPI003CF0D2E8
MGRVWVVGSLNVDRPWRVVRHPAVGETVVGEMLAPLPGGKGLNQAVAAVRAGADASLLGTVGDDADGRWLQGVARDEGIDVAHVVAVADAATGSALIVVDEAGANTVTVSAGANARTTFPEVPIAARDVVVAQLEVPVDAVTSALMVAHVTGARSILNPSPIGHGVALVPSADVVVVNQHEAAALVGPGTEPAADSAGALAHAQRIRTGDQIVVVTLGADGVVASGPSGDHVLAGIRVQPVDTTGAGDCFLGVLAAGLARGDDLLPALERANHAAAISVTRAGTVPAMPAAAELDDGGGAGVAG